MAKETIQYVETAEEKRWRAESDARALAEAEVIKNDPKRLTAAQKMAEKMAKDQKKESDAMMAWMKANWYMVATIFIEVVKVVREQWKKRKGA